MFKDNLSPLEQFQTYKDKFREIAEKTFDELTIASRINIEDNRILCKEIQDLESENEKTTTTFGLWTLLCILMWIVTITCIIICISKGFENGWIIPTLCIICSVSMIILLFWKIHPIIKEYIAIMDEQEIQIKNKKQEAWDMMDPLNKLYDWDVFFRMMTQAIPHIKFDPYFTNQRLADFINNYGWNENSSENHSVIFTHSGLINGNSFVIARTRKMKWIEKVYTGELTIEWTTIEIDSNGNKQTKRHSETLHASVSKPYPEYIEKTRLIYGNTAAPNLNFTRDVNLSKLEVGSLAYKLKLKSLENLSRDLKKDFTMAPNEEFEILFTTTDRNNEQEYFLLFTPLAQENMIKIIRDKEQGYGGDFKFMKRQKLNTLIAEHMQDLPLDMNPQIFWNYNYDNAKQVFLDTTCENFRAIYFGFAPLFSIPMYQQIRPVSAIYGTESPYHSSYWEHESIANFHGEDKFANPACVTPCILKTIERHRENGNIEVEVRAYGHRTEHHVEYVSKRCRNGQYYNIPVHWDEYIPVMGTGDLEIQEDTIDVQDNLDPVTRMEYINQKLNTFGENSIYRRHIISRIKE